MIWGKVLEESLHTFDFSLVSPFILAIKEAVNGGKEVLKSKKQFKHYPGLKQDPPLFHFALE